jgi:hypothetical protein
MMRARADAKYWNLFPRPQYSMMTANAMTTENQL